MFDTHIIHKIIHNRIWAKKMWKS